MQMFLTDSGDLPGVVINVCGVGKKKRGNLTGENRRKFVMTWRKVEDELPEPQTLVLVYAPNCHIIGSILIGKYFVEKEPYAASWTVYDFGDSNLNEKVTHWMPRPDAPK